MIVVNTENTTHTIKIIPRFSDFADLEIDLYNEETQETETVASTFTYANGYLNITFDYTFTEGQKRTITVYELTDIIYRGKIQATTQNTQTFKSDNGLYYF